LKTTTASPKVKKTGPALLKKLARELAIIADHDQKTILRLAAHLALAANGIQPITNLPLDKRALNELWTIFGSADRANRADCANEADRTNVADCANGVEDKLASALDHSEFARVLTAPLALEQITDSQIGGLVKLARAMARGCDLEVFRDPLFVASLREAIVETGTAAQKSRHTIDSPLLPTQFFTPTSVANKIAKETPCRPGETILDPACGGGHLLVPVFFECLKQHELAGATDTASSARQIFEQQLYGYDIDQSLVDICRFSLYLAARQVTRAELPTPNIKVLPGPSGSLALAPGGSTDTAQKETRLQVDHIVMNPPYQSTRTIDSATSDYIKTHYANASGDLYTAFIELALRLLKDGGTLSAITQQSFLSISRYRQFRLDLLERSEFIHYEILGPGVFYFCPGEKVNSIVFTLQKKAKPLANKISDLCHSIPGNPIVFDAPIELAQIFSDAPQLAQIPGIDIVNGLFTCNNKLFVKDVSLVSPSESHLYVPYDKGGGKKWYHQTSLRLNWGEDGKHIREYRAERGQARALPGERFYFKPGVTYSYIGTSGFSARLLSPGSIFDIASSAIFSSTIDAHYILGWLNSSLVIYLLSILNPTVNFQIGDLRRLPFKAPDEELESRVASLAKSCVELVKECSANSDAITQVRQQESDLQQQIDELIFEHYKIDDSLRLTIQNNLWVVNARARAV
jgi:hypothetical protein